jgi:uncharacterized protein (DUF2267 family)
MASSYDPPFEIHVHGEVPLRADVSYAQLQDALKPLWSYAGASSLAKGAISSYEEEPGIRLDDKTHVLSMCWTVAADESFRSSLEEMCMNLNELSSAGASIEISIYDAEFDDEDEESDKESRDDFLMLFVGPTPGDIMQVQRDMLIEDVTAVMERHFEKEEMGDVVTEIDKMFSKRFDAMVSSLTIPRSMRGGPGAAGGSSGGLGGHGGGGRKPRHLH